MATKEFELANMCDDLVDITMEICGKAEDGKPRFPKWSYTNFVDRIVRTALDIQELVIESNEFKTGENRSSGQIKAAAKCVYLNHLIRISWQRGHISQKQHDRWSKLVTSIKWKIANWWKRENQ